MRQSDSRRPCIVIAGLGDIGVLTAIRPTRYTDIVGICGPDRVRTIQARLTGVDRKARKVFTQRADGASVSEDYDALAISTGVTNGFWRRPELQSAADVDAKLRAAHDRVGAADSVIVVGGGAAAVSAATRSGFPHGRSTAC